MATLREVAALSGVSVATASHVINNRDHNMSAETRERVLDAIRTLNYRPGTVPTREDSRRSHTVGVFIFLGEFEYPLSSNPYAVQILDGILATAMPKRWNVTFISVHAWEDARAQVRLFVDGRCDGFVLVAPRADWEIKDALIERGYPCVLINAGLGDKHMDTVDIDNAAAAREMTSRLIEMGHQRIAFLPGGEDLADSIERIRGFKAAFADADSPDSHGWVLPSGDYDMNRSIRRVHDFLDARAALPVEERPTALFCSNDNLAIWAREVMRERGVSVPEEISLVGFDDIPAAAQMQPPLSTVRQPFRDLGARATEMLLERISQLPMGKAHQTTPVSEFLPYEIVLRESVIRR